MDRSRVTRWFTAAALLPTAAVLAAALALGACGGGTSSGTASPTQRAAEATPSTVPTLYPAPSWRPGSDTLAGTAAVARRWARLLRSEKYASADIWAEEATFDNWPSELHDNLGSSLKALYMAVADSSIEFHAVHVLVRPGAAAVEEQFSPEPEVVLAALQLLGVSDGKILHDEVFYDVALGNATPVRPWPKAPGAADTVAATRETVEAFSEAMTAADLTTMRRLLDPDLLFYDVARKHEERGADQFAAWWGSLRPVAFLPMETAPLVVGEGWAVWRWTAIGTDASTAGYIRPGATVYEVRDGKVVRLTIYHDSKWVRLHD